MPFTRAHHLALGLCQRLVTCRTRQTTGLQARTPQPTATSGSGSGPTGPKTGHPHMCTCQCSGATNHALRSKTNQGCTAACSGAPACPKPYERKRMRPSCSDLRAAELLGLGHGLQCRPARPPGGVAAVAACKVLRVSPQLDSLSQQPFPYTYMAQLHPLGTVQQQTPAAPAPHPPLSHPSPAPAGLGVGMPPPP